MSENSVGASRSEAAAKIEPCREPGLGKGEMASKSLVGVVIGGCRDALFIVAVSCGGSSLGAAVAIVSSLGKIFPGWLGLSSSSKDEDEDDDDELTESSETEETLNFDDMGSSSINSPKGVVTSLSTSLSSSAFSGTLSALSLRCFGGGGGVNSNFKSALGSCCIPPTSVDGMIKKETTGKIINE